MFSKPVISVNGTSNVSKLMDALQRYIIFPLAVTNLNSIAMATCKVPLKGSLLIFKCYHTSNVIADILVVFISGKQKLKGKISYNSSVVQLKVGAGFVFC